MPKNQQNIPVLLSYITRVIAQVFKMDEEEPARLVEVANLEEHDDIVSSVAASRSRDGLVLSGSYDRR